MNEPVALGEVLLGKYRVERLLGQGGMGVIVAVRHVDLGQLHAMKLLLPTALENQEAHERFLREARAVARLTSDHVVRVQDVGYMDNGVPYMLMEYLEGCDLKALILKQGRLSVVEAVGYVLQVCEAMTEAHAAGIVHRDLKPANLFLVRRRFSRPCVKVLDFGISKQTGAQDLNLTDEHATLGSPLYMAPEQMGSSKTVDGRTDIWALGVVLYELLTGTSPFEGNSMVNVISRVLQEEPTRLRDLQADIPMDLEQIIDKCLRKRAAERFQTMQELQAALAKFGLPDLPVPDVPTSMTNPAAVGKASPKIGDATQFAYGKADRATPTKRRSEKGLALTLTALGVSICLGGIMQVVASWLESGSTNASVPLSNSAMAIAEPDGSVHSMEDVKSKTLTIPQPLPCPSCVIVEPAPSAIKPSPVPSATVTKKTPTTIKRHHSVR